MTSDRQGNLTRAGGSSNDSNRLWKCLTATASEGGEMMAVEKSQVFYFLLAAQEMLTLRDSNLD